RHPRQPPVLGGPADAPVDVGERAAGAVVQRQRERLRLALAELPADVAVDVLAADGRVEVVGEEQLEGHLAGLGAFPGHVLSVGTRPPGHTGSGVVEHPPFARPRARLPCPPPTCASSSSPNCPRPSTSPRPSRGAYSSSTPATRRCTPSAASGTGRASAGRTG